MGRMFEAAGRPTIRGVPQWPCGGPRFTRRRSRSAESGSMALDAIAELEPERLRRLIDVGRSLVSELNVEQVLDRLLDVARDLTGARYAALGILDDDRRELARFITRGVDAETHAAIGDLPRGRGILGVLIEDPRPLRLPDVTADPRSYGFPIGHPPMGTFLGVPVLVRGQAWGNLYLTEKAGGEEFDDADEASVIVLADWAAIAIENARLYETIDRRRAELERAVRGFEATAAIVTAVGAETDLDRILELVVKRARALMHARSVEVLLADGDDLVVVAAAGQIAGGTGRRPVEGTRTGEAFRTCQAVRVDDVDRDPGVDSAALGVPDASTALIVPLVYRGRALGVLCAFDRMAGDPVFDAEDEQVLHAFAASAATAVATARSVEDSRLRAAIESAEAERGRWARELHDETLQALGGLKLLLAGAVRADDPERLRAAAQEAVEHITHGIEDLRAIIADLRPAALDALGLGPALETLAARCADHYNLDIDATIELDEPERLSRDTETAVYRVAQEALTNVVKHAGAGRVELRVARDGDHVVLRVRDDGDGFDPEAPAAGFGVAGMHERAELAGGRLTIAPSPAGTLVEASFPVGQRSASSPRSSA
jgi:signal transduction histidine kinase